MINVLKIKKKNATFPELSNNSPIQEKFDNPIYVEVNPGFDTR